MFKYKFLEKSAKPSTVVAIAQDQGGNLQSNNADECFIDCSYETRVCQNVCPLLKDMKVLTFLNMKTLGRK